jgi:GT2 family glycosyltransferase
MAAACGEIFFLANPDIEFLDGSVGELMDVVVGGADVVGPQLFWDPACEVVLPIPDDPGPAAELARTLRRRWPGTSRLTDRIDTSWRVWTGEEPVEVPSLRGPLLALRRETARRLGPLDEGYFLYYEETDWLWRARRMGACLKLAPRARVVHRWGHATRRRRDLDEIEARSRTRFFRRNHPVPVRALLRWLSGRDRSADDRFESVADVHEVPEVPADVWLLSIVSRMEPAVGCLRVAKLPPAACELASRGRWYAVAARRDDRRWRLAGSWRWERDD